MPAWALSAVSRKVHLHCLHDASIDQVGKGEYANPGRASNGQVAVSAFGSGCACPTAVIAICPICQCSAEPQLEVCSAVHPSSLCPLAAFASWALQGYACIQVKGHSLPVVLL